MTQPKKFRFVSRAIEGLPPCELTSRSKSAEYSDTSVTGFKLQVTKTGHKAFYFRYTFHNAKRAIRIGEFPATSVEEARQRCLEMRAAVDRGVDPQAGRDRLKAMPTFGEFALGEYLPFVKTYKRSADDDESKIRLYLLDAFGPRRLCDVTTRDIQMYLACWRRPKTDHVGV